MSRRLKRLLMGLFLAFILGLGFAAWLGWLPGEPSYEQIERDFR